jgi:type I restriction enzyme S subunit
MSDSRELLSLADMMQPVRDFVISQKDSYLPYIGLEHLEPGSSQVASTGRASDSISMNIAFKPGDILFGKLRPYLRKSVAVAFPGYCSTEFIVLRSKPSINPSYAAWIMRSAQVFSEAIRTAEGTRMPRTSWSRLADLRVRAASLVEQRRIAEVLDTIDEQIQASVESISKLGELRIASIRESMASALESYHGVEAAELRSATRRSIGSWSLVPLGSLLSGIDAGHSPDLEDTPAGSDQWGVLKVNAVGNGFFRPGENKVVDDRALCNPATCVRRGDLLMTRANTTQLVGLSCIVEDTPPHLMLCDKTLRLRVAHPYATARYVHIVLGVDEVRRQIEIGATGTSGSMKNISQQAIRRLMIPLGGAEDIERVIKVDALFKAQLDSMRSEVERLRALKQGLMDDLLTGRVRVTDDGAMERVGTG